MHEMSPYNLPHLSDIFDALRRGRHLCAADGDLYWSLHEQSEAYTELFYYLGFTLEKHQRDFYYFQGKDNLSPLASRMAVFLFILIESLADQGEPVVDSLMTKTFSIAELPHLRGARYRSYLKEAETTTDEDLLGIVRQLDRLGFATRKTDDTFCFRTPVYRFLDTCMDILNISEPVHSEEGE